MPNFVQENDVEKTSNTRIVDGQTWNIAEDIIQTREANDTDTRLVQQGKVEDGHNSNIQTVGGGDI